MEKIEDIVDLLDSDDFEEYSYSTGQYNIVEREKLDSNLSEIVAIHKDDPSIEHVVAISNRENKIITIYPSLINAKNYLKKIVFEGFESINDIELISRGFCRAPDPWSKSKVRKHGFQEMPYCCLITY